MTRPASPVPSGHAPGCNQRYAYEILRLFGRPCPPLPLASFARRTRYATLIGFKRATTAT